MTHDRLDTPIPCHEEALEGGLCYYHTKIADGLTDPPPDKCDDAYGGRESEGLRAVTNTATGKTLWERG
jgi:hypothetical protein